MLDFILVCLVSIIVFFGLVAGIFLAFIAPEELNATKKFLFILRDSIFLILIYLFSSTFIGVVYSIIFSSLFVLLVYFFRNSNQYEFSCSFLLSIVYSIMLVSNKFKIAASLFFLYFVVLGIILSSEFEKNKKVTKQFSFLVAKAIKEYFVIFLTMILVSFLTSFLVNGFL